MTKFRETIGAISLVVFASSLAYGQLHTSERINSGTQLEISDDFRMQRKALGHIGGGLNLETDGKVETEGPAPGQFETQINLDPDVKLDARTDNQVGFPPPDED